MEDGSLSAGKLFTTVCTFVYFKHLKMTANQSLTKEEMRHQDKTTVTRLHHFVTKYHVDRDNIFQPLAHESNTHAQKLTKTTPDIHVLERRSP